MTGRGMPDRGTAVPLFGMAGTRRDRARTAELEDAFSALCAAVRSANVELGRRPRQLAELDRAVSRLYAVLFVQQAGGAPCVFNLLDQHATRLDALELLADELRSKLDVDLEPVPLAPLARIGGAR